MISFERERKSAETLKSVERRPFLRDRNPENLDTSTSPTKAFFRLPNPIRKFDERPDVDCFDIQSIVLIGGLLVAINIGVVTIALGLSLFFGSIPIIAAEVIFGISVVLFLLAANALTS